MIASMLLYQLIYTYTYRAYNGELNNYVLANNILFAWEFASTTTFNLAHWFFAYSYLVLSYRADLLLNNMPEDTYNCRINAVNIVVCLFNIVVPLIYWVFYSLEEYKAGGIAYGIEQSSLVMSCVVLIWGICKLLRLFGSANRMLPNKVIIIMHIVAYLFIIIVDITLNVTAVNFRLKAKEISTICNLVIYFVCTLIFGLIVNTIVTKIELATNLAESTVY